MSSITNNQTHTTDLPSFVEGGPGRFVEIHNKMIEVKKERLKALMAFAKSQTLLSEIDVAIAQYELKLEINKLRKSKRRARRAKNKNSDTTPIYQAPEVNPEECTAVISPEIKTPYQNTAMEQPQTEIMMDKETLPKPKLVSGDNCLDENNSNNNLNKTESLMCSIPLSKIVQFQNPSAITRSIISTFASQQNASDPMDMDSANNPSINDRYSDISTDMPPLGEDVSSAANSPDKLNAKQHLCVSMLRVTHRYNISIVPRSNENQSLSHDESDHIVVPHQSGEYNQPLNDNRLLIVRSLNPRDGKNFS